MEEIDAFDDTAAPPLGLQQSVRMVSQSVQRSVQQSVQYESVPVKQPISIEYEQLTEHIQLVHYQSVEYGSVPVEQSVEQSVDLRQD